MIERSGGLDLFGCKGTRIKPASMGGYKRKTNRRAHAHTHHTHTHIPIHTFTPPPHPYPHPHVHTHTHTHTHAHTHLACCITWQMSQETSAGSGRVGLLGWSHTQRTLDPARWKSTHTHIHILAHANDACQEELKRGTRW